MTIDELKKKIGYKVEKDDFHTRLRGGFTLTCWRSIPTYELDMHPNIATDCKHDIEWEIIHSLYEDRTKEFAELLREFLKVSQPVTWYPEIDTHKTYHELYNKMLKMANHMAPIDYHAPLRTREIR